MSEQKRTGPGRPRLAVGDRSLRKLSNVNGEPVAPISVHPLGVRIGDYVLVTYEVDRIIIQRGRAPDHTPAD